MLFRNRLTELRKAAGLTQEVLAIAAGVAIGNVRNYKQVVRVPRIPAVVKLATALDVDCTAFAKCVDITGRPADRRRGRGNESEWSSDNPAA
jgi:transcriptional regulator with XRE-family HTH domain